MGFPDQSVPLEIKKTKGYKLFMPPPGKGANTGHPGGSRVTFQNKKAKRPNQGLRGPILKRENPNALKAKKILELLNL